MSVLGIATIAKHKNLALSPLLTKAHFLVASEPVAKLDRLQKIPHLLTLSGLSQGFLLFVFVSGKTYCPSH